jgi:protein involved in polysaccharide export with SLBB domain
MNFPLLASVAPGDQYLVDVGDLVPVAAVSARSAYFIAMTARYGPGIECPPEQPMVYQIDANGELIAVFD